MNYPIAKDQWDFSKGVIKNAAAITIAKESNCVKLESDSFKGELEDETIEKSKYLKEKLKSENILREYLRK